MTQDYFNRLEASRRAGGGDGDGVPTVTVVPGSPGAAGADAANSVQQSHSDDDESMLSDDDIASKKAKFSHSLPDFLCARP